MSNDITKLLERIAVLESRLADANKPATPVYDNADPVGSLTRAGADLDYLTKILVARAMGDQAPPELRVLSQLGPQIATTRALESQLEDLRRQVTGINETSQKKAARESFRAIAADKTKYPALAKALAADPEFFDEDLDRHQGSAEELATKMEARLVKLVPVEAPPASDEDADTTAQSDSALGLALTGDDQSTKVESANQVAAAAPPARRPAVNSQMPPLARPTPGVFTPDEHAKLRDEIVRKYQSGSRE